MRSYCCFADPRRDFTPRDLEDDCPVCGRPFGFPLSSAPRQIDRFRVEDAIDRGFYGATYIATVGNLGKRVLLKVVPVGVYAQFPEKDFEAEAQRHRDVAAESAHLVDIEESFQTDVTFGDLTLPCHVAVLEYVDGPTLERFLATGGCTARQAAQIAIDLFNLLGELERRSVRHNDLHGGNLIVHTLPEALGRADAVDPQLILKAVDLGSLDDASHSDPAQDRPGDLGHVARHLGLLVKEILRDPDNQRDSDYRLASVLDELAVSLRADPAKARPMVYRDLVAHVREAFDFANSPWHLPVSLGTFAEGYNAQDLHPWWVSQLLVDPKGTWYKEVAQPGPVLVQGMRGCGKTMLLRALQFQARVSYYYNAAQHGPDRGRNVIDGLAADGYVGLYLSCNRLLDNSADPGSPVHEPNARLFVAYAREGLRAIRRLRDMSPDGERDIAPAWLPRIGRVVSQHLAGAEDLALVAGELELEHSLQRILVSLNRGDGTYSLPAHPVNAFTDLAESIRGAAEIWQNVPVYFLLDDVSARHLQLESVKRLLSQIIFSSPVCAFKITTETQTIRELRSPGLVEPARTERDYVVFDLGGAVNERLHRQRGARDFVADILTKRAQRYPDLDGETDPRQLLGDASLEEIAMDAASTRKTAAQRKAIYHGLGALAKVCVGDIGDVIHIYDLMLRRRPARSVPIPKRIQSTCFQDYCNQQIFRLNTRGRPLLDAALSFAQASRELLAESHRSGAGRLRQYNSLHINITTGDRGQQFEQIRELVDAGVFVFTGGTESPRMKTRDRNPTQQFTLTFRKLLGISNFIGLAERDRFELSGRDVEEWLANPTAGKEILLRNLGSPLEADGDEEEIGQPEASTPEENEKPGQLALGLPSRSTVGPRTDDQSVLSIDVPTATQRVPVVEAHDGDLIVGSIRLIAGLGFEQRTLASIERLVERLPPGKATVVRYPEAGKGAKILAALSARGWDVDTVTYAPDGKVDLRLEAGSEVMVDVTGLAKPVIFVAVRDALRELGRVHIAHTEAKVYYPRDEDIRPILAGAGGDPYALLSNLEKIWRSDDPGYRGEAGPYQFRALMASDTDESRARLLIASVSPKHQRLLSLVENRDFDRIEFLVPAGDTPRSELSRKAAEVVAQVVPESGSLELGSNDLSGAVAFVAERYDRWYTRNGYAVEFGLTGSKLQTVAFAAVATARKISQSWYVQPRTFDTQRFTRGVGPTRLYRISRDAELHAEARGEGKR